MNANIESLWIMANWHTASILHKVVFVIGLVMIAVGLPFFATGAAFSIERYSLIGILLICIGMIFCWGAKYRNYINLEKNQVPISDRTQN